MNPLAMDESRLLRSVSVALVTYEPPSRETLTGQVFVFLDEDGLCTTVETAVNQHWEVVVYNDGATVAHWRGDSEDAPGHEGWHDMDPMERVLASFNLGTPYDRKLSAEPISGEGVSGWEICLAPLGEQLGHLIVPYIAPPAPESL